MPDVDVTAEAEPSPSEAKPRQIKCWTDGCGQFFELGGWVKVEGVNMPHGVRCATCLRALVKEGKQGGDDARVIARRAVDSWRLWKKEAVA